MFDLSPDARAIRISRAIAALLQHDPGLTWTDVQMLNEGPGWDYELMWYEQHPLSGPAPPELIRGDRLEELTLMRAWQLGRIHAALSAARRGA